MHTEAPGRLGEIVLKEVRVLHGAQSVAGQEQKQGHCELSQQGLIVIRTPGEAKIISNITGHLGIKV